MKQQNISLQSSTSVHNSQVQQQVGVNGSLADNRLSYSVQQGWQNQRQGTSGGVGVNWQGASGLYSSAYTMAFIWRDIFVPTVFMLNVVPVCETAAPCNVRHLLCESRSLTTMGNI
ncbi:hypothetical protein VY476_002123 [Salmonella enterica]|nr:hypothetical protein [Salmonella enterica]